jgi:hypothetical protein
MAFVQLASTTYQKSQVVTGAFTLSKKTGRGVFFVSIPTAWAGKPWDGVERCRVALGTDEDTGLLHVAGAADGAFRVARLKHALVLRVSAQHGWADQPFSSLPLEVVSRVVDGPELVLRLPPRLLSKPEAMAAVAATQLEQVVAGNAKGKPEGLVLVGNVLTSGKKAVRLGGPQLVIMMRLLLDGFGNLVRYGAFVEAIWGSDPNGGPEEVQNNLKVNMAKLRTAIEPLNLVVITQTGLGWLLAEGRT